MVHISVQVQGLTNNFLSFSISLYFIDGRYQLELYYSQFHSCFYKYFKFIIGCNRMSLSQVYIYIYKRRIIPLSFFFFFFYYFSFLSILIFKTIRWDQTWTLLFALSFPIIAAILAVTTTILSYIFSYITCSHKNDISYYKRKSAKMIAILTSLGYFSIILSVLQLLGCTGNDQITNKKYLNTYLLFFFFCISFPNYKNLLFMT